MEEKIFKEYPVGQALAAMVLPTIVSQVIFVIYNIADTWFVGLTNDANAVAALSLCLPVYALLTAFSNLFGSGGASVMARAMGRGHSDRASQACALAIWGACASALSYAALMFVVRRPLLLLIGGDGSDIHDALIYATITIIIGGLPTILANTFGHLVRASGHPKTASFGMILGALLNIGLDPLFMFVLLPRGNEVAGAAIATALSNLVSCLFLGAFMLRHQSEGFYTLRLGARGTNLSVLGKIVKGGLPAFCMVGMAMFSNCFLNGILSRLGSAAVAGVGIVRKIDSLAYAVNQGITQGMLPLVAYCFAAGRKLRMRKAIWYSTIVSEGFSLICTGASILFAPELVGFFIREPRTIHFGAHFLRILCIGVPIYSITFIVIAVLQAVGKGIEPFILSILHKGTLDVVLMFVLAHVYGIDAILWASPISEICAMCIALAMLAAFLHRDSLEQTTSDPAASEQTVETIYA